MSVVDHGVQEIWSHEIKVPPRLRPIDPNHVETIAESIRQIGRIIQPITVAINDAGEPVLVAGAHRFSAARETGLEKIPAIVLEGVDPEAALLMEIDENLIRHELNPLDRAVFLAERKVVYERLHPETKKGGDRVSDTAKEQNDTMSFSSDTAEKTGLGKRTIERAVRIAKGIPPELRKQLIDTPILNNQSELLKLADVGDKTVQKQIVDMLMTRRADKVDAARNHITGKVAPKVDPADKEFADLIDKWNRASKAARDNFISVLVDAGACLPIAQNEEAA